jgi:8-oxo-dGTP pyrophosphatase MutT (NUDIX family)
VGLIVHSVAMSAAVRNFRDSLVTNIQPPVSNHHRMAKSVRFSELRKVRECRQVAAVCYRFRHGAVEFLLVRTRGNGRRWTFPKGSAEPGLTHAQAAALEAFEEAGVHGRIEEASFTRYFRSRGNARNSRKYREKEFAVGAHLCEVLRLRAPKEASRHRTWFSVEETKQRLREGRKDSEGNEFVRVVGRAARRIRRLQKEAALVAERRTNARRNHPQGGQLQWNMYRDVYRNDGLRQVQFEYPHLRGRFVDPRQFTVPAKDLLRSAVLDCEVVPFAPSRIIKPPLMNQNRGLLSGTKRVKALGTGAKPA